jgi:hypothetical protein
MVALSVVLVAIVVCLITYWFYKQEKIRRNADKLGGPKSLPIIGNVHQLRRKPKGKLNELLIKRSKFIMLFIIRD